MNDNTNHKTIKASAMRALSAAAAGHRLTAREAKLADEAGLLIREPRTGWCLITERGRNAMREAGRSGDI